MVATSDLVYKFSIKKPFIAEPNFKKSGVEQGQTAYSIVTMVTNTSPPYIAVAVLTVLWLATTEASNRWDVLRWCTTNTPADVARCEGLLSAAVDLRTSDDFSGTKSCFLPDTNLADVREEVVAWLKNDRTAPEKSGLGLVARALQERFPCPN